MELLLSLWNAACLGVMINIVIDLLLVFVLVKNRADINNYALAFIAPATVTDLVVGAGALAAVSSLVRADGIIVELLWGTLALIAFALYCYYLVMLVMFVSFTAYSFLWPYRRTISAGYIIPDTERNPDD